MSETLCIREEDVERPGFPNPTPPRPNHSVARGTGWGVGGQAITLTASFIATPIILRLVGPSSYGVLSLTNLLMGYLAAADMGMGITSTRFAAQAYGRGDGDAEVRVVWTSLLIASLPSLVLSLALVGGARHLAGHALGLPPHLQEIAVVALRLTAVGFFARNLSGILNTPQLVRMRLDLFTLINVGTNLGQIILVPVVLAVGGGLTAAVAVIASFAVANAAIHAVVSGRLVPDFYPPRFDPAMVRPLARFGLAILVSSVVGTLLMDAERLLLPGLASVSDLGYYAVAYTLARMLTVVPGALSQALLPAFARLHGSSDHEAMHRLYRQSIRMVLLFAMPACMIFILGGRPFLTLWAGPAYGRYSSLPFYVLVVGATFNSLAMMPHGLLCSSGKAGLIARYNLAEMIPYLILITVLTRWLGPVGAALAWSTRMIAMTAFFFLAARPGSGFSVLHEPIERPVMVVAFAILALPVLWAVWTNPGPAMMIGVGVASVAAYAALVWTGIFSAEERAWGAGGR